MKKTIALIEDNADNRLIVSALLRRTFDIDTYTDGFEGLEGLRRKRPDVVLLDISLPGKDGVEVLHDIRQDAELSTLPVVAFTAHAMAGDREMFLAEGFDDYLAKPIVDETLLTDIMARLA